MWNPIRSIRRRRLRRQPFPPAWLEILETRVPFFEQLPESDRPRFCELLKIFVAEKYFIGAGDLEVTEEMKVVIAACAVRLILHLRPSFYNNLTEIVIYPEAWTQKSGNGQILGEAHKWGTVVLSWSSVQQGLANTADGHDTATHEFAHVLDVLDGAFDGAPPLASKDHYAPWAQVLGRHYKKLKRRHRKERQVLRAYGATNPAEFFAVATESFFEKPTQMKEKTPELYKELTNFYGQDPATNSKS